MKRNPIQTFFNQITPTQFIVLGYFSTIILTALILWLPFTRKSGADLSLIDAFFTSVSAVTVTGLTVVNTADTFNLAGHIVLLISFQIGGIGIMALGTLLWMILGKNIGLSYRRLIMIDQNRHSLSGLVRLIRLLIVLALIIEAVGALLFSFYFFLTGQVDSWREAVYYGTFHAISSYTNAGFDIFGNSLHSYVNDYFVQTITMILIVLGAIGFPVLVEVREYFFGGHQKFRFSLFTKMTSFMFFFLIAAGAAGIWLIERELYFAELPWHEKLFFSLFNSVTARSGGLATMDVSEFSVPAQFLISVLMFIGASPSSVGGGIRTTTFALILLTLATYASGKVEVRAFRRSIKQEDIIKSFVVFTAATILVITSIIVMDFVEMEQSLIEIVFEVTSAFGTCGLSTGISEQLSPVGKIIIMGLMFAGRIGMLTLLFMFRTRRKQETWHYPKEELIIG